MEVLFSVPVLCGSSLSVTEALLFLSPEAKNDLLLAQIELSLLPPLATACKCSTVGIPLFVSHRHA